MFQGQSLRVTALAPRGVYELCFDRQGEAINKLDERTVSELWEARQWLAARSDLRGVLVTSAKDVFIVGADITEFGAKFGGTATEITAGIAKDNEVFGQVARTQAAASMVRSFLNEQAVRKLARARSKAAPPVLQAVMLGAGIMGGGIAYTSAPKGIPARLKDVAQQALDLGMAEAAKQVARQEKVSRLAEDQGAAVLRAITPQLDTQGLARADVVVEAIVENLQVKRKAPQLGLGFSAYAGGPLEYAGWLGLADVWRAACGCGRSALPTSRRPACARWRPPARPSTRNAACRTEVSFPAQEIHPCPKPVSSLPPAPPAGTPWNSPPRSWTTWSTAPTPTPP